MPNSLTKRPMRYTTGATAESPWPELATATLPAVAPASENSEHVLACFRRDRLFRHMPDRSDGETHLLDVRLTTVAACQVLIDKSSLVGRERILEVGRDQLDQFATDDLIMCRTMS
jgi:hypothetical protein